MQAKAWIMLKVLLNRYHPKAPDTLLRCLPEEEMKAVTGQEITSKNISLTMIQPQELMRKIHYSWLMPAFEKLPKGIYNAVLSSLLEPQSTKLRKALKVPATEAPKLAPAIQTFLANTLYSKIKHAEVLPIEFLPHTPLTVLAEMDKVQLVELINFLGIYDLADEVRSMIDRNEVKKLHACLTSKQKQFLHQCMHHKEKITAPPLELRKWDGDCRKLETLMHLRGLVRLGKALCGQHPDLVWHIQHILDTGRGEIISRYFAPESIPAVTPALIQQIINLINFLKPKSTT